MRPSRLPSTKSSFRYRLFAFDAVCALSAPIAALLLRNPTLLARSDITSIITYTVVSFGFCVVSFIGFRLPTPSRNFSRIVRVSRLAKPLWLVLLQQPFSRSALHVSTISRDPFQRYTSFCLSPR